MPSTERRADENEWGCPSCQSSLQWEEKTGNLICTHCNIVVGEKASEKDKEAFIQELQGKFAGVPKPFVIFG
ncbi:MAG: hypothetical protein WC682_05120 [Parcubacteria group bacterium]|jgi:uncharacterized Zn finger protein (UPF0148 family)